MVISAYIPHQSYSVTIALPRNTLNNATREAQKNYKHKSLTGLISQGQERIVPSPIQSGLETLRARPEHGHETTEVGSHKDMQARQKPENAEET